MSGALTKKCDHVIALDLQRPPFTFDRVTTVAGDVTRLDFATSSVDCVLCAEVLEHIPQQLLPTACREITRVSRMAAVVGVPFRQDLRVNRTRCASCNAINPPWGHVNQFDVRRLADLFKPLRPAAMEFVWVTRPDDTNVVSAALMRMADFPYGTYNQDEPCVRCGAPVRRRGAPTGLQRAMARASTGLDGLYRRSLRSRALWLHMRFEKS